MVEQPTDSVQILLAKGGKAYHQGDYETAEIAYTEALQLAQAADDRSMVASCLINLGAVHLQRGEHQRTLDCLSQSSQITQALGEDQKTAAATHMHAGILMRTGKFAEAIQYFDTSIAAYQRMGAMVAMSGSLGARAICDLALGHIEQARTYLETAIELQRQHNHDPSDSLSKLGEVLYMSGAYNDAAEALHESLVLCRAAAEHREVVIGLSRLTLVNIALGQEQQAKAHLLEGAQIALEIAAAPTRLEIIRSAAFYYSMVDKTERSACLGGLLATHSAAPAFLLALSVDALKSRLLASLDNERIDALWAEGTQLDIETTLQVLITELT